MKLSITYVASILALFYAASNAAPVSQIGDVNSLAAREPGAAGSRSKPPKDSFARRELGTERAINDLAARSDPYPAPPVRVNTGDHPFRRRFRRGLGEGEINEIAARAPAPPGHSTHHGSHSDYGNGLVARSDTYLKPPARTDTNDHPYRHRFRREIAAEEEDLIARGFHDIPPQDRSSRPFPMPTIHHYRRSELDAEDEMTNLVARGGYIYTPPRDDPPLHWRSHRLHRRELDAEAEINDLAARAGERYRPRPAPAPTPAPSPVRQPSPRYRREIEPEAEMNDLAARFDPASAYGGGGSRSSGTRTPSVRPAGWNKGG